MDPFKAYTTSTAAYLLLQSLPLLTTPSLIVTLVASDPRQTTDLETYLCRSFGLALLTLSILIALLTNALPLASTTDAVDAEGNAKENPYAYPTLLTTTVYHLLSAFYLYTQLTRAWTFAFTCGIVASSGLFCLGLWTVLFAGDKGRRSKTGTDKRTSGFPFENKESARSVKREERKEKEEKKRRSVARTKSRGD